MLALVLFVAVSAQTAEAVTGDSITVTGSSSVSAPADQADLQLSINTINRSLKTAVAANANAKAELEKVIGSLGLKAEDLRTTNYWMGTREDPISNSTKTRKMQAVNHSLSLKLRDLRLVGKVVDRLVEVSGVEMSGVSFSSSKQRTLANEASKLAVADAQEQANILAKAAGVKISGVREITSPTSSGGIRSMEARAAMAGSADTSIEVGELQISSSIMMVFKIN